MVIEEAKERPPMPALDRWREKAITWQEDIPYKRGDLVIESTSFNQWVRDYMTILGLRLNTIRDSEINSEKDMVRRIKAKGVRVGPDSPYWLYCCEFSAFDWHQPYVWFSPVGNPYWRKKDLVMARRDREMGRVTFDGNVNLLVMTEFRHDDRTVWMSLTPSEVISQRSGLRTATGNVLMGGLGLGWLAVRVLQLEKVEHLTVVERDLDLINLVGSPLKKRFGSRLSILHQDFYSVATQDFAHYDAVLADIWKSYGDARYDREWLKLRDQCKAAGVRAWAWD